MQVVIAIILVFGFNEYILRKLYHNRHELSSQSIIQKYGLFYAGLKDTAYTWELIIVSIKKFFFIGICFI